MAKAGKRLEFQRQMRQFDPNQNKSQSELKNLHSWLPLPQNQRLIGHMPKLSLKNFLTSDLIPKSKDIHAILKREYFNISILLPHQGHRLLD
jgi:hypothetical protein